MKRELSVACLTCTDTPEIARSKLDPVEIIPWLLNLHAVPPHTNHRLSVEMDGQENVNDGEHDIEIRCTRCAGDPAKKHGSYRKHRSSLALVGALVMMMHTRHEAHPMELLIDGVKVAE